MRLTLDQIITLKKKIRDCVATASEAIQLNTHIEELESELAQRDARIAELERIKTIDTEYIERSQQNDERLCARIKELENKVSEAVVFAKYMRRNSIPGSAYFKVAEEWLEPK